MQKVLHADGAQYIHARIYIYICIQIQTSAVGTVGMCIHAYLSLSLSIYIYIYVGFCCYVRIIVGKRRFWEVRINGLILHSALLYHLQLVLE